MPTARRLALNGTQLKTLACASMLLDHFAAACLLQGVLYTGALPAAAQSAVYGFYWFLRLVGRLAFPIYCFLLVEGFLHTRSAARYAARLLGFALLSELPFDYAFYRTPVYTGHQNVYFTLFLGLAAIAGMQALQQRFAHSAAMRVLLPAVWAAGCCLAAEAMAADYGAVGVAAMLLLYLCRASRRQQCLAVAALFAFELTGPLAALPIWRYNGQRGHCPRALGWFFYIFYPAHLLALGLAAQALRAAPGPLLWGFAILS